jgi:hypothetical protein
VPYLTQSCGAGASPAVSRDGCHRICCLLPDLGVLCALCALCGEMFVPMSRFADGSGSCPPRPLRLGGNLLKSASLEPPATRTYKQHETTVAKRQLIENTPQLASLPATQLHSSEVCAVNNSGSPTLGLTTGQKAKNERKERLRSFHSSPL